MTHGRSLAVTHVAGCGTGGTAGRTGSGYALRQIPLHGRLIRVHSLGIDLTREGDGFTGECGRLSGELVSVARAALTAPVS